MKFIRLEKEVHAVRWSSFNASMIERWSDGRVTRHHQASLLQMETKYGVGYAHVGDWVIRGACGLYYPCSDRDFRENYKEIK